MTLQTQSKHADLIRAVRKRDPDAVQAILSSGASVDIDAYNDEGYTPLYCAVYGDREKPGETGKRQACVELLLDAGANVNRRVLGGSSRTAHGSVLNLALKVDDFELANLLLDRGADGRVVDYSRCTALHHLVSRFKFSYHNCVEGYAAVETLSNRLLDLNPSLINQVDASGASALSIAIDEAPVAYVKHLTARGADVNAYAGQGIRLVHTSWRASSIEMLRLLVGAGADLNCPDSQGRTAPFYAKDAATFETMIELGADIQVVDNLGQNLLCYRADESKWDEAVFALLIQEGVSPVQADYAGETAIAYTQQRFPDLAPQLKAAWDAHLARNAIKHAVTNGVHGALKPRG
jgi:ankyrin repeat protein